MLALKQSQRTLRQHVCFAAKSKNWRENYSSSCTLLGKMSANEVTTPKKHVKPSLGNCKVCGITTQINARAVKLFPIPQGKLYLGKNVQAYSSIDVGEEKERSAYCCRNCKLKLETIVNKIPEIRELFYKTSNYGDNKKNTQSKNLTQSCNLLYVNTNHSLIQCASSVATQ